MNSKEALETLGNVEVAVTTIKSGITNFKTLKEQYETEFEVLERALFIKKELKDFDVYQEQMEKLEKELKQTKLNFKNSQIHSKNCYKKLKEKYTRLERAYKNNEVMTKDLNELINRNLELKKVRDNYSDQLNYVWNIVNSLKDENTKLKQALEKACERLDDDCPVSQELIDDLDCENCESNCKKCWKKFFLKEVFESVGGSDE